MFVGKGARSLQFVEKPFEDFTPIPLWAVDGIRRVTSLWQYGQVSITGTKQHQVLVDLLVLPHNIIARHTMTSIFT